MNYMEINALSEHTHRVKASIQPVTTLLIYYISVEEYMRKVIH